jgi:hypothetical protein
MLIEEVRLVNEEFLKREDVYNLTLGGRGGWFIVQQSRCNLTSEKFLEYKESGRLKENGLKALSKTWTSECASARSKSSWKNHRESMMIGHLKCREAAKSKEAIENRKLKFKEIEHQKGEKNSRFGTKWLHNDELKSSKSFKKEEIDIQLSNGWKLGRKMKF